MLDSQFGAGDGYLNCKLDILLADLSSLIIRLPVQLGMLGDRRWTEGHTGQTELKDRSRHALRYPHYSILHTPSMRRALAYMHTYIHSVIICIYLSGMMCTVTNLKPGRHTPGPPRLQAQP